MFIESPRFPECISFGASGGPAFLTEVIGVASGFEQRNEIWQFPRLSWEVSQGVRSESDMHALIAFFQIARGRLNGFRFKDWSDFESDAGGEGLINSDGHPTGAPTMQLYKRYTIGGGLYALRIIAKPINGSVAVLKNGVVQTTGFALDYTTGVVSFSPAASVVVSNISKANPALVTCAAPPPFVNGQTIWLRDVVGMTQVNNRAFVVSGLSGLTFQLTGEDSTGYGTFTGTAHADLYEQPAGLWTWTGEFDVPCRFDTDAMKLGILDRRGAGGELWEDWQAIPVIELRQ